MIVWFMVMSVFYPFHFDISQLKGWMIKHRHPFSTICEYARQIGGSNLVSSQCRLTSRVLLHLTKLAELSTIFVEFKFLTRGNLWSLLGHWVLLKIHYDLNRKSIRKDIVWKDAQGEPHLDLILVFRGDLNQWKDITPINFTTFRNLNKPIIKFSDSVCTKILIQ